MAAPKIIVVGGGLAGLAALSRSPKEAATWTFSIRPGEALALGLRAGCIKTPPRTSGRGDTRQAL